MAAVKIKGRRREQKTRKRHRQTRSSAGHAKRRKRKPNKKLYYAKSRLSIKRPNKISNSIEVALSTCRRQRPLSASRQGGCTPTTSLDQTRSRSPMRGISKGRVDLRPRLDGLVVPARPGCARLRRFCRRWTTVGYWWEPCHLFWRLTDRG
jgi:hypothetical protein